MQGGGATAPAALGGLSGVLELASISGPPSALSQLTLQMMSEILS